MKDEIPRPSEPPESKVTNRDTELLKIQILADYYHSRFTTQASFLYGFIIAWGITFVALFYQKNIDMVIYTFSLLLGYTALGAFLYYAFKDYSKKLNSIDGLIVEVNKGVVLPSLKELKREKMKEKS
jgi:hypothetical protein